MLKNDKHLEEVRQIWAWSFDGVRNDQVKFDLITSYCNQLRYQDPVSADEIYIFMHLPWIQQTKFTDQLKLPIQYEEPKTFI